MAKPSLHTEGVAIQRRRRAGILLARAVDVATTPVLDAFVFAPLFEVVAPRKSHGVGSWAEPAGHRGTLFA